MFKAMISAIAMLTLAACASVPVSPEKFQASEQAIQWAAAAGAERDPAAAKYLELARGEMSQGKQLSDGGSRAQAETMLQRAEADARLASATAQENASKAEVKRLAEALKAAQSQ